ncbi:fungal specific transcription factor domain-containing protein [Rutstroemia sp. NJR-2017a BBW]|nr:fungal specific transcription factor domain-containing protein [Rutstroemia sp. NJR-2017a BBW]
MSEGRSEPIESSITPDEANRIIHSHRKVRYGSPHLMSYTSLSRCLYLLPCFHASMLPYMVATPAPFTSSR